MWNEIKLMHCYVFEVWGRWFTNDQQGFQKGVQYVAVCVNCLVYVILKEATILSLFRMKSFFWMMQ